MYDKAVDDFLPALKFVPDWFVTSKMIKRLHNALFTDDDILFFDIAFSSDEMSILSKDLNNNNNLDHVNFYENDLETIIHVRIMAWRNLNNGDHLKKI